MSHASKCAYSMLNLWAFENRKLKTSTSSGELAQKKKELLGGVSGLQDIFTDVTSLSDGPSKGKGLQTMDSTKFSLAG